MSLSSSNIVAGFPDPFAVATINGEQTKTTAVSKRTLNPYWNEPFDLYATFPSHGIDDHANTCSPVELMKIVSSQYRYSTRRSSRRRIKVF